TNQIRLAQGGACVWGGRGEGRNVEAVAVGCVRRVARSPWGQPSQGGEGHAGTGRRGGQRGNAPRPLCGWKQRFLLRGGGREGKSGRLGTSESPNRGRGCTARATPARAAPNHPCPFGNLAIR